MNLLYLNTICLMMAQSQLVVIMSNLNGSVPVFRH